MTDAPTEAPASMRAWRVHEYGEPLGVLRLEEVPLPEPGDGEVRVRAEGIPFNLNDLERINGGNMMVRPEFPYSPGMETMGVVDAVGAGAESLLGKRVVGSTVQAIGGYAEYALCTASATFEMPDDIPLPDAAALFFPFHLAWLGLFDRAGLQAGETVLIHAAAGGSGSAAVQLAVDKGAHVIATCGTDEKAQLCRDLGAQTVVNYTTDDFLAACMEVTGGKGVDVVFDNVGEAVMENGFKATAYNGRYVLMGFASNKVVADEKFLVPRQLSLGNFKLMSVMLSYADAGRQQFMKQLLGWNLASDQLGAEINAQIVDLVRAGRVKAVVGAAIDFDQVPQGITDLAGRDTVGRVVALV
jgi:NADPH2:quinone reductase